jgi:eukaryotic-like serine/threonine-protein kinase
MPTAPEAAPEPTEASRSEAPHEGEARVGVSLAARILLGASLLLATTLGVMVLVTSREGDVAADARILRELERVPALLSHHLDPASARERLRSLAEEPAVRSLLARSTAEPAACRRMAVDIARRLGADEVSLLDPRGALLGRAGEEPASDAESPSPRPREGWAVAVDSHGARTLSLLVSAPVVGGDGRSGIEGGITARFTLDAARAKELARAASADVAVLARVASPDGPVMSLLAASSELVDPALMHQVAGRDGFVRMLFENGEPLGPLEVASRGDVVVATALPIRSDEGTPVAAVLAARSKSAETAVFRGIRRTVLLAGLALGLLALLVSLLLARAVTRPIRQLALAAEEIGRGQFDVELPRAGGEVGALVQAFATMVNELRGKAELEAVVADGRRGSGGEGVVPPAGEGGHEISDVFAGRYELLSVLGEGGMGTVYRARDRELDDEVALKMLKPVRAGSDADTPGSGGPAGELLRHEIKLARMVTHANVVRVHDYGEADGVRYITMEYVPGTTLRQLLAQQPLPELGPTLQIAKQVCRGLAAVHRAGIVHGDLKPQNVIVKGNGVVKLMDFGVARTRSALARGEPVAGTPAYMSPEQARGADLDERSDLYAAGVLFFELFTGRCPFVGRDPYETMRMHLDEPPPSAKVLRPHLPESLSRIISTCLEKSRLRRPASAAELERLLMRVRP